MNSICCCFSSTFGESGCRPSGLKADLHVNSSWIKAGKKIAKPFLDDLFGSGNLVALLLAVRDLDGMYTSR